MPIQKFTRNTDSVQVTEAEAMAGGVLRAGYRLQEILRDGERVSFPHGFHDSAGLKRVTLRDAAGQPVTLYDEATGGSMKLNTDLIAAIESEAAKLGMSVNDYVQHVLKYSWASANLSGRNPSSPAETEK